MNVSTYVCREDKECGFVVGDVVGCGAGLVLPQTLIYASQWSHMYYMKCCTESR
jgi:hypothetical protein